MSDEERAKIIRKLLHGNFRDRSSPQYEQLQRTLLYEQFGGPCRIDDALVEAFRQRGFNPRLVAEKIFRTKK